MFNQKLAELFCELPIDKINMDLPIYNSDKKSIFFILFCYNLHRTTGIEDQEIRHTVNNILKNISRNPSEDKFHFLCDMYYWIICWQYNKKVYLNRLYCFRGMISKIGVSILNIVTTGIIIVISMFAFIGLIKFLLTVY